MPIIQFRQTIASNDAVRPFDLTDRGLLLGDGVFDTSLVKDGRMILRERHIGRLVEACDVFGHEVAKTEIEALAKDAVPEDATGALDGVLRKHPLRTRRSWHPSRRCR
jgi:branched-chain amino acid aminotransferase